MSETRNATPAVTLEQRIMDPCVAKSEAEWWAHREIERLRAEIERLRDVLRRVSVHPSGDWIVKISFISEGCMLTFPVVPSTTWSLEVMIEFDKARREALEGKP